MTAATQTKPAQRKPVRASTVWIITATGPAVWIAHLGLTAAVVPWQCNQHGRWLVNVLTVVCAVAIAASMLIAYRLRTRALRAPDVPGNETLAFVALVGLAWGGISLAVTIVEGLPNTVLSSCPK